MRKTLGTFTAAVLVTASVSLAQDVLGTPDGETPALESVCEMESGAAFGLCNAYCEAMDCELANDGDDSTQPRASETACLKVKDKYIQQTGNERLPCELDCPCFDRFEAWARYQEEGPWSNCSTTLPLWGDVKALWYGEQSQPDVPVYWTVAGYLDFHRCGLNTPWARGFIVISPQQVQACQQQISNAAVAAGIGCVPWPF